MNILEKMGAKVMFEKDFTSRYQSLPVEIFKVSDYLAVLRYHRDSTSESVHRKFEIYDINTGEMKNYSSVLYDYLPGPWKAYYYNETETHWYIYSVVRDYPGETDGGSIWTISINKTDLRGSFSRKNIDNDGSSHNNLRPYFFGDRLYGTITRYNSIYSMHRNILNLTLSATESIRPIGYLNSSEILRSDNFSELPVIITRGVQTTDKRSFQVISFGSNSDVILMGRLSKDFHGIEGFYKIGSEKYFIVTLTSGATLKSVYHLRDNGTVNLIDEKELPIFNFVYGNYLIGDNAIYNISTGELIKNDEDSSRFEIINISSSENLIFTNESSGYATSKNKLRVYKLDKSNQGFNIKINDKWVNSTESLIKINESWKSVSNIYTKINGVWR